MIDLRHMNSAERELVEALKEGWPEYGRALRDKHELNGGMQWKTVGGREYLTRYRQDPETGKKKWESLGRRSPETEATYNEFMERRASAREIIQTQKDDVALAGRLARAHGLTRLPTKNAEILRSLWLNSVDRDLVTCCGASLLAYEQDSHVVTPAPLVRDTRLIFLFDPDAESVDLDAITDAYEQVVGAKARIGQREGVVTIQAPDAVGMDFLHVRYLVDRALHDYQADILSRALHQAPYTGATIASDGQPVELKVVAPQAYAMVAHVLGSDDEIWAERAEFAGAMVRERWEFDPDQEDAFPGLGLDHADSPPRI